jgi:hypothetical protein
VASKSKTKGKTFEREVCKVLSEIYDDNFERVPHSGAFVGGQNASRKSTLTENQIKAFKGDIIPPDSWKYFNCECKNYADFPFHHLLQDKSIPLLDQWIEQTMDAHDTGDIDLLFMKFNRKGIYLAFPKAHKTKFFLDRHITYPTDGFGYWTITYWDDFKANKINTDAIETMATKGIK